MLDGRPTVQYDSDRSSGRDSGVQGTKKARSDEAGKDTTRNTERISNEEEIDRVERGKRGVGVTVEVNLTMRLVTE